ncbi:alpha,alpha-trehalose-phosphate synthase (UDP-forming) [Caenispirillum bisanense]|uniref:Trehalose-6-phosphate synthase n=1 Tax=Caenispirillum bisanense TaxID=414052 RepID=A0A286GWL0_9PROT|nr:alpha,alpha-trehalose-phosphate synthase (UDP-forming) [Caenispirillum bisanense]SOD99872.1 trehalose 6-phosphate synthase [Caenispirillum bisanense]
MSRLVVVSNRVAVPDDGPARAGGLAVALREALQENGGIWFGWSGKTAVRPAEEPAVTEAPPVTYATLDLSRCDHQEYYNGFANRTLWPLFHYRLDLADFNRQDYTGYLRVNTHFAEKLQPLLRATDDIWVHDYHLIPFASELRRLGVANRIGFFLHTPFPAMEVFLALPSHERLARSLCAYDVVGFQTMNDLRAFQDYIVHEQGGEFLGDNMLRAFGRTLRAEVYPIGIEVEAMQRTAAHAMQEPAVRRLIKHMGERRLMIGVDRLDYSKGIPERFRSFERFLEKFPSHQGSVSLMQIAPVSRGEVPEYKAIRSELEHLAGHINGVYGELDWMPIRYLNKGFPRETLTGFYRACRVGVVTPLRDGMNLVAKEYVASQNPHEPGVLVLSRFAGAARELDAAVLVNPFDHENVADALNRALAMSLEERTERWEAMMQKVHDSSLDKWRERFLSVLRAVPEGGYGAA